MTTNSLKYTRSMEEFADILAVVRQARTLFLKGRNAVACVSSKQGKCNYVTNMDLDIQSYLCEQLKRLYPAAKFIAEENNGTSEKFNYHDEFFIIDPIDGTTNCLHDYASCAVCVAYVLGGETLFGAVYSLADDELFYAAAGCGAYLNGKSIHVSGNTFERSLVCIGTASHDYDLLNNTFLIARDMCQAAEDVRRSGSAALDICNVACGRAEVFYEMRLFSWDYAAAALILQEAGGWVSDFYGSSLNYENITSLLATNRIVHPRAQEIILRHWTRGE